MKTIEPLETVDAEAVIAELERQIDLAGGPRPWAQHSWRRVRRLEEALEQAYAHLERVRHWNASIASPRFTSAELAGMLPGLFDELLPPARIRGDKRTGATADLTRRRKLEIALGGNPATHMPLLNLTVKGDTRTCGSCANLVRKETMTGHVFKCVRARQTNNDGPDIVKRWPACTLYLTRNGSPEKESIDAPVGES